MRNGSFSVCAVLGILAGSACGGPSAGETADELATSICTFAFDCCSRGEVNFMLGPYVTQDDCAERIVNSASIAPLLSVNLSGALAVSFTLPNLSELQRAIDDGRTKVNGDALDTCLAYIAEEGCNEFVVPEEVEGCVPPPLPEETPCETDLLFEGQIGEGGECTSPGFTFECQPGLVCRTLGAFGVKGACVAPGDEGALCFTDAECLEDLYCSQADGTCQFPRQEGETCAFSNPDDPSPSESTLLLRCEEGLSCDPVTDLCVAPCKRGAVCSSDLQCDIEQGLLCVDNRCDLPRPEGLPCTTDLNCEMGLRCAPSPADPSVSLCQEKLADGESCQIGGNDECASGFCDTLAVPDLCAPTADPGELCPRGVDAQCAGGYCENENIFCTDNTPCTGSGVCNTSLNRCEFFCVSALPDGAICERGGQCASEACVDFFCRTVPLADGEPCNNSGQCESQFCGLDGLCDTLPLANGKLCFSDFQCESGICFEQGFEQRCVAGLSEGDVCGDFSQPECGRDLFCDFELATPTCVPVFEAGIECEGTFQCRAECVIRFGRQMCDATPPVEEAICDGPDA